MLSYIKIHPWGRQGLTYKHGLPIYQQIADEYRQRIIKGELSPGTLIPPQAKLAVMHGTSEVTIRKALKLLVTDGLISRVRKRGTFVREVPADGPNLSANGEAGRIRHVYFVYNDVKLPVLTQEIHRSTLDGIADACNANGIELVLHNSRQDRQLPKDPDAGYLLWGFEWKSMSVIEGWKQANYKMVTLHNYFPHLDIPHVNSDNYTGGYLATQHLLSLGHTRVGIILLARSRSSCDLFPEFALRLQGFNLAMSNNGIAADPSLVFAGNYHEQDLEDLGYFGMKYLMELADPPTAVFAATDFTAMGALKAAEDLGLTVPDDVSMVGYDGYSFAKYTKPALTTVDQNFYGLGKAGIEKLLNVSTDFEESRVRPQLIIRESTKEL